jgi:hypothetical protein
LKPFLKTYLNTNIRSQGVFCFYAGTNIVALIMIFLWVPETKQRTLEELDYIFAVPTKVHMRYQLSKALPWFIQRYIFFRKSAVLQPLYHFDSPTGQSRIENLYANDKARAERKEAADRDTDGIGGVSYATGVEGKI